jgi:hypothetical protein
MSVTGSVIFIVIRADVHSYCVGSIVWSLYLTGCDNDHNQGSLCMLLRIGGIKK